MGEQDGALHVRDDSSYDDDDMLFFGVGPVSASARSGVAASKGQSEEQQPRLKRRMGRPGSDTREPIVVSPDKICASSGRGGQAARPRARQRAHSQLKRELRDVEQRIERLKRKKEALEEEIRTTASVLRPSQEPLPAFEDVADQIFPRQHSNEREAERSVCSRYQSNQMTPNLDDSLWYAASLRRQPALDGKITTPSAETEIELQCGRDLIGPTSAKTQLQKGKSLPSQVLSQVFSGGQSQNTPDLRNMPRGTPGETPPRAQSNSQSQVLDSLVLPVSFQCHTQRMPKYRDMSLDELRGEMDANGLKHRSRAVMVKALESIWMQLYEPTSPEPQLQERNGGREGSDFSILSVMDAIKASSKLHEDVLCLQKVTLERVVASLRTRGVQVASGEACKKWLRPMLDQIGVIL